MLCINDFRIVIDSTSDRWLSGKDTKTDALFTNLSAWAKIELSVSRLGQLFFRSLSIDHILNSS